jgi:hypothetical protein
MAEVIECGTTAGYRRHRALRTGTDCPRCLKAWSVAQMLYRIRTGRVQDMKVPIDVVEAALGGDQEALPRFFGPEIVTAIEQWGDTHSVRPEVVASVDATLRKTA